MNIASKIFVSPKTRCKRFRSPSILSMLITKSKKRAFSVWKTPSAFMLLKSVIRNFGVVGAIHESPAKPAQISGGSKPPPYSVTPVL